MAGRIAVRARGHWQQKKRLPERRRQAAPAHDTYGVMTHFRIERPGWAAGRIPPEIYRPDVDFRHRPDREQRARAVPWG